MPGSGPLRLADAAGVLSLATDLAMGQPLEHGLRTAVLGVRTAAALGLPEQDLAAVFYTGMRPAGRLARRALRRVGLSPRQPGR